MDKTKILEKKRKLAEKKKKLKRLEKAKKQVQIDKEKAKQKKLMEGLENERSNLRSKENEKELNKYDLVKSYYEEYPDVSRTKLKNIIKSETGVDIPLSISRMAEFEPFNANQFIEELKQKDQAQIKTPRKKKREEGEAEAEAEYEDEDMYVKHELSAKEKAKYEILAKKEEKMRLLHEQQRLEAEKYEQHMKQIKEQEEQIKKLGIQKMKEANLAKNKKEYELKLMEFKHIKERLLRNQATEEEYKKKHEAYEKKIKVELPAQKDAILKPERDSYQRTRQKNIEAYKTTIKAYEELIDDLEDEIKKQGTPPMPAQMNRLKQARQKLATAKVKLEQEPTLVQKFSLSAQRRSKDIDQQIASMVAPMPPQLENKEALEQRLFELQQEAEAIQRRQDEEDGNEGEEGEVGEADEESEGEGEAEEEESESDGTAPPSPVPPPLDRKPLASQEITDLGEFIKQKQDKGEDVSNELVQLNRLMYPPIAGDGYKFMRRYMIHPKDIKLTGSGMKLTKRGKHHANLLTKIHKPYHAGQLIGYSILNKVALDKWKKDKKNKKTVKKPVKKQVKKVAKKPVKKIAGSGLLDSIFGSIF